MGQLTNATIGLLPPTSWLCDSNADRTAWLGEVAAAGIHHLAVGDHVSFIVGAGSDGLIDAANPTLTQRAVRAGLQQAPIALTLAYSARSEGLEPPTF
jgi:hypothetical protein